MNGNLRESGIAHERAAPGSTEDTSQGVCEPTQASWTSGTNWQSENKACATGKTSTVKRPPVVLRNMNS